MVYRMGEKVLYVRTCFRERLRIGLRDFRAPAARMCAAVRAGLIAARPTAVAHTAASAVALGRIAAAYTLTVSLCLPILMVLKDQVGLFLRQRTGFHIALQLRFEVCCALGSLRGAKGVQRVLKSGSFRVCRCCFRNRNEPFQYEYKPLKIVGAWGNHIGEFGRFQRRTAGEFEPDCKKLIERT